eukprot:484798-Rhodomonas_salina.2
MSWTEGWGNAVTALASPIPAARRFQTMELGRRQQHFEKEVAAVEKSRGAAAHPERREHQEQRRIAERDSEGGWYVDGQEQRGAERRDAGGCKLSKLRSSFQGPSPGRGGGGGGGRERGRGKMLAALMREKGEGGTVSHSDATLLLMDMCDGITVRGPFSLPVEHAM